MAINCLQYGLTEVWWKWTSWYFQFEKNNYKLIISNFICFVACVYWILNHIFYCMFSIGICLVTALAFQMRIPRHTSKANVFDRFVIIMWTQLCVHKKTHCSCRRNSAKYYMAHKTQNFSTHDCFWWKSHKLFQNKSSIFINFE